MQATTRTAICVDEECQAEYTEVVPPRDGELQERPGRLEFCPKCLAAIEARIAERKLTPSKGKAKRKACDPKRTARLGDRVSNPDYTKDVCRAVDHRGRRMG